MADNFNVTDASGSAKTIGAKDLSTVYLTKHIIVDDAGDIALVSAANAALAENVAKFLQTASVTYALDDAASAGSQAVPLEVESTAAPNLKVGLYNGTAKIFDAVARRGYVQHTDGTNSTPAGDAAARPIYVTPVPNAASGGSIANTNGLAATVTAVKASAGVLHSLTITNTHSAAQFVQVFNTAAGSVTLGTTAPIIVVEVPAGDVRNISFGDGGATFGTAISWAATTTATGSSAASANTVYAFATYK